MLFGVIVDEAKQRLAFGSKLIPVVASDFLLVCLVRRWTASIV